MELDAKANAKLEQQETASKETLSMDVFREFDACRDLAPEWDAFVERVSGDIFLTYDWCRIWWKYFGKGRQLRIYLFRADRELVGLMPMFLETVRIGPISVRRAKMVSSDSSTSQFRPAIEAEFLGPVVETLLEDIETFACDQIVLGPLAGRYASYPELLDCLRQACGGKREPEIKEDFVQTYYPLAASHDRWLETLSSPQRNLFGRDYRNLKKQGLSFLFEVADGETWEAMFDDFVELHQEYWNRKGKLGHFGGLPQSLSFYRELARAQLDRGRLRLFCLRCSDGSRAYSYNFRCGDMYFEYILARSLDAPQGVSVSRLLHSETVKQATGESAEWVDTMRGEYEYKRRLGGRTFPLRLIYLNRADPLGRIRIRLFNGAIRLLHLFYYKIYFYRLSPKLPLHRRKGLWNVWVRTCGL